MPGYLGEMPVGSRELLECPGKKLGDAGSCLGAPQTCLNMWGDVLELQDLLELVCPRETCAFSREVHGCCVEMLGSSSDDLGCPMEMLVFPQVIL